MCLKENYSDSPSNEYSRHYSAESEYLRRQDMNSKSGEEQKKIMLKSLEYRRLEFDAILMFKIYYNLSDLQFDDYFMEASILMEICGNRSWKIGLRNRKRPLL